MATEKLLGRDDESGSAGAPNYWRMDRYVALKSGTITEIKIRSTASGNVKVAIYADKAGEPGELLGANNDGQAVTSGWNTLTIEPIPIIKGTHYWLAHCHDATGGIAYNSGGGIKYKAATYSTFTFPDPAGTGFTSYNAYTIAAAWGDDAITLIGPTDETDHIGSGANYWRLSKFTSLKAGTITQLWVYSAGSGNVKLAIYKDNAGLPGDLITAMNTGQALTAGWKKLNFTPTNILKDTPYWLSAIPDTDSATTYIAGGTMKYRGETYSSFTFPSNAYDLGALTNYNGYELLAGWGIWVPGPIVILDGQYITETPEVNRAYVIGRDAEGNPVHGTDLEQSEIDLVGERLDFQQHLSIPTSSLAADVADAMLKKQRLSKHRGFITIPPNCGQELWDVIQVTDTPCAQSASNYRVVAISFDYQPRQRRYQHKLFLAAP